MDLNSINQVITTLGFPIACVIGLGLFIVKTQAQYRNDMNANMERLQTRCLEREALMTKQIEKSETIIEKAIDTLSFYENNLSDIKTDVSEIKEIILTNKNN